MAYVSERTCFQIKDSFHSSYNSLSLRFCLTSDLSIRQVGYLLELGIGSLGCFFPVRERSIFSKHFQSCKKIYLFTEVAVNSSSQSGRGICVEYTNSKNRTGLDYVGHNGETFLFSLVNKVKLLLHSAQANYVAFFLNIFSRVKRYIYSPKSR